MQHFADNAIRVIWYAIGALWLILAFRTKRTVRSSGGMGRLAVIVVVAALVLARPLSGSSLHNKIWTLSPASSVVVLAFVMLGAAFAAWARLTIGTNWSGVVTVKENHELIQRGPYHLVRHPIYSGLLLMGLASAVAYDEAYGFIILAVAIAAFVPKMMLEEKLMTQQFPDQYPQYRTHVKAIIPFIL